MDGLQLRDLDPESFEDNVSHSFDSYEFAGRPVHALDVDTVVEHLDRHELDYETIRNQQDGPEVKADFGNGIITVKNYETINGPSDTTVTVATKPEYNGAETIYQSRFRTLEERERKSREAAEWSARMMEKEGEPWQIFNNLLDGRSFEEAARDNFEDGLEHNALTVPYGHKFELKPWQDIDDHRPKEFEGEMPSSEYEEKSEKLRYWFQDYLSNVAEAVRHRTSEKNNNIDEIWIKNSPEAGNPV